MNRSHLWKFLLIVFVTAWAVYSMYPPTTGDVLDKFKEDVQIQLRDAAFTNIVQKAEALHKQFPDRKYSNLREAIGTNDITRYFPYYNTKGEKNPTQFILHRLQREVAGKIRLGLDLQGGSSFLVEMSTNKLGEAEARQTALSHAVEVLRRRVDNLGVAEPIIQSVGENNIIIQLPGLSEEVIETARRQIQKAAFLEFRMVHPESMQRIADGIVDPGYEVLQEETTLKDGTRQITPYLVKREPERGLTGKYLKHAFLSRNHLTGQPQVSFELDAEGAKIFEDITTEYGPKDGRHSVLAIVLDGELRSAPRINEPIRGGSGQITGGYSAKEASELVSVLQNPLEAPVKIIEERTVEPSLGKDSITSGIYSAIYGTIGVAAFMMLFYFFAGGVANFALFLNVIITIGVMCMFGATLTLPGIAGLVLSIGMAVDANVLIFERIREERAVGKSLRGALAAGYDRAFGTILDSHVTTLISALILYWKGTGPIKGFGVTLTIGVAASLFTALVVTRLIFDFLIARNWMKSLPMMPVMRLTKVDFIAFTKPAFVISVLIILGGVGYGIFGRGHKMLGVDFAGGDSLTLSFTQRAEQDKLREVVSKLGVGDPMVQYQKPLSGGRETLQILAAFDSGEKIEQALKKEFPQAGFQVVGIEKVGPTVGKEIQKSALISSFLAFLAILFYVALRYEFSFAVAAVVATGHDVLFTLGIFALAGGELSSPMVAAILTIIGYSINDKIVILDRIREDLKLGVRGTFRELINLALNQTLSRTLITGGSVIVATLALYIFGGGVINDFAFTFLVGILAGTYSSIFIASAIVLGWNKGERPKMASQVTIESAAPVRV
jgi:SecD/SecF fusion protein